MPPPPAWSGSASAAGSCPLFGPPYLVSHPAKEYHILRLSARPRPRSPRRTARSPEQAFRATGTAEGGPRKPARARAAHFAARSWPGRTLPRPISDGQGGTGGRGHQGPRRAGTTETWSFACGPDPAYLVQLPAPFSGGREVGAVVVGPGVYRPLAPRAAGALLAGQGLVSPWIPSRRVVVRQVLRACLDDGFLGHVLSVPQVGPVGQGVAVRAQGDEVLGAVGPSFSPGYVVVDLEVLGGIAQGAPVSVPLVDGLAFLFV